MTVAREFITDAVALADALRELGDLDDVMALNGAVVGIASDFDDNEGSMDFVVRILKDQKRYELLWNYPGSDDIACGRTMCRSVEHLHQMIFSF